MIRKLILIDIYIVVAMSTVPALFVMKIYLSSFYNFFITKLYPDEISISFNQYLDLGHSSRLEQNA